MKDLTDLTVKQWQDLGGPAAVSRRQPGPWREWWAANREREELHSCEFVAHWTDREEGLL